MTPNRIHQRLLSIGNQASGEKKPLSFLVLLLFSPVLLSSCLTMSGGELETNDFYISEIVVTEAAPSLLESVISTETVKTTPASTRLSKVLHRYAAAYNKLKANHQIGLRLKVQFTANYAPSSTGGAALEVAASVLSHTNPGTNTITTKSTLVDPTSGKELRWVADSYTETDFRPKMEIVEPVLFKGISNKIMRSVFSLKSTPESVSESLQNGEVAAPIHPDPGSQG